MKYEKNYIYFFLVVCFAAVSIGAIAGKENAQMGKMKMQMMENMKKVMSMKPEQMRAYIMKLQQESLEHGKKLFEKAGPTGISCSSCHPNGKTTGGMVEPMAGMKVPIPSLAGASGAFPKFKVPINTVITLEQMHNNCLMMFNKTDPLPLGSKDAVDLAAYVSQFSNGKEVKLGAHPEMEIMQK